MGTGMMATKSVGSFSHILLTAVCEKRSNVYITACYKLYLTPKL